jgi:dTDP-4-dehydrorhamnose reductase
VINTAAYTAVDKAEESPEKCQSVNAEAVLNLAEESTATDCCLVQVSTDYVFGGPFDTQLPFVESDPPCPRGVYATTKLQGEIHAAVNPRHYVVRSCGLYGEAGPTSTGNFVTTMLRLGRERDFVSVVNDQRCTPTWIPELARAIIFLTNTNQFGLYHIVNGGETTWFGMAREIFRIANIQCQVEPITTEQYGALAPRPAYSVLNTEKYESLGGPKMSMWDDALAKYMQSLIDLK